MTEQHPLRGWIAIAAAIVLAAGIGLGGHFLPVMRPATADTTGPVQGETSSVCTTGSGSSDDADSAGSEVYGATAPSQGNATGSLSGRPLGSDGSGTAPLSIASSGQGGVLSDPDGTVVLTADGVMASSSAGMVYGATEEGENRGLSLGPCTGPAVEHWFTGLGATDTMRSQLVLSNSDETQAEVDLRFFGPNGQVNVPGGSGMIIPGGRERTISLQDLLGDTKGPVTVHVAARSGRVSAMARDLRSDDDATPTGADWHPASLAPATEQVIPAIPGDTGDRTLVVNNPGQQRAEVSIEVLGPQGSFTPTGTSEISVEPQQSEELDLTEGLSGAIGTVRVRSDQPVVTAAQAETVGRSKPTDISVAVPQSPIASVGLVPAGVVDGAKTEMALSNGGDEPVTVGVELINTEGVGLYSEEIPIPPGGSIERRISQAGPGFLVARVPDGAEVYGGVSHRQVSGNVFGLAGAGFVTPGLAGPGKKIAQQPDAAQ